MVSVLMLLRTAGRGRGVLLAGCTAVVSALLLVAVAILRLPAWPREALFSLVADTGTRYGTTFAVVLLTVPPLLMLHQAVRLGTASRERRLASLRLAGATPAQVRLLAAVEVGVPSLVGAALGIGGYRLLRWVFGGGERTDARGSLASRAPALVPTSVAPTWWQALLVVVAVTAIGILVGLAASHRVVVSPLGLVRRQPGPPPRPWGAMLLLAAAVLLPLGLVMRWDSQASGTVAVGLAVLGMVSLAPWAALSAGRIAERRARTAPALLAARRLVAEPRPAGRAAAALGGIALVCGGSATLTADLVAMRNADSFYFTSMALVGLGLLLALVPVVGSLAVHSAESLLEHRRSIASLAALGATPDDIVRSQRWEAGLTALPVTTLGVLLGAGALMPLSTVTPLGWLVVLGIVVATPLLVWLALCVAVLVTRPLAVRAADPAHLRTG
jgi:FtsX-like permease family protein